MTFGFGLTRTSATSPSRTWFAVGRVDQQVGDARQAAADLGRALDPDVEDLLLLEQVADREPGDEDRRCAAHVARLDPVLLRPLEVGLDLDRRLLGRRQHARIDDAVDPGEGLRDLVAPSSCSTSRSSP